MGRNLAVALVFLFAATGSAVAQTLDTSANSAANWLLAQQNADDGSWGATDEVKYVQTSEAVLALAALNKRTSQYYAGLTWLQNHAPVNIDYTARRVLALQSNGSSITTDLQSIQAAQALSAPGNNGWGLSKTYQGAALDTALVLQAYNQAGINANVPNAVSYLLGAQLSGTDQGWVIGQESISDPATTAQVLIALIPLKATNATLPTTISNGLAALNAKVTTASPVSQQALSVIANLRNAAVSPQVTTLLNNLTATQGTDGSWGSNIQATALAVRAEAAGIGRDLTDQQQAVNMPDAKLRAAVNQALGRGAMDQLNRGELVQLTSLSAANRGITDLTGLQYATNLTYLDLSGNSLSIPANADSDADGVTDLDEIAVHTNPYDADSKPWFKNYGPAMNYAALTAATPSIAWQDAWNGIMEDLDHDNDQDLVLYFQGASEHLYDLTCTYDCGDDYVGPDFGSLVYLENVNGSYVRRSFSNNEDTLPGDIERMVTLDFNNDGKMDLLLVLNQVSTSSYSPSYYSTKAYRRLVLFQNNGIGFSDVTASVGLNSAAWHAEGLVLDLNGDGYPDILGTSVDANYSVLGDAYIFNPISGTYTVTTTSGLPRPLWVSSVADLNGDGKLDIVAQDGTLGMRFFRNLGNGSFSEWGNTYSLSGLVGDWLVKILPADMDNDGLTDLVLFETEHTGTYVQDYAGGKIRVLHNEGFTGNQVGFTEQTSNALASSGGLVAYGGTIGDVNNDGYLDIMLAGHGSRLVVADGTGGYHDSESTGAAAGLWIPSDRWADPVFVDFNLDGKVDLLSPAFGISGANYDSNYLMINTGGSWSGTQNGLSIELTGQNRASAPSSGKDAFGARVEVTAGGHTYTRSVLPIMGLSHRLYFGLGTANTGIQVKIYWPDSPTPQILSGDPYVNSILKVTEP